MYKHNIFFVLLIPVPAYRMLYARLDAAYIFKLIEFTTVYILSVVVFVLHWTNDGSAKAVMFPQRTVDFNRKKKIGSLADKHKILLECSLAPFVWNFPKYYIIISKMTITRLNVLVYGEGSCCCYLRPTDERLTYFNSRNHPCFFKIHRF